MKFSNRISAAWRLLRAQPPPNQTPVPQQTGGLFPIDRTPTAREEFEAFEEPTIYDPIQWSDPDVAAKQLRNEDFHNDIREKKRFAKHAYRLNHVWIFFLFLVTLLQGTHLFGFKLDEWGFRIIFVSTTATVFGFALLVGKYLFPSDGRGK